jgi:cyclase
MRIIARLDIKNENLIKGINFEGLRIVGDPNKFALNYYKNGVDEIIFMDVVASLYGRNQLTEIINFATKDIFIPIIVGGGIRSIEDAEKIFSSGADKIAINTAAVQNPHLIENLSKKFGSQSIILSVEAKKKGPGNWEVFTENGRQETGLDVLEWVKIATEKGVGEILLTSVDMEGTKKGFDFDLIKKVTEKVNVPIIASGGFGRPEDMLKAHLECFADAIAIADAFHFNRVKIQDLKEVAIKNNIQERKI